MNLPNLNQSPVDRVLAHQVMLVVSYALHKTVLVVVVLDDAKVNKEVEQTGVCGPAIVRHNRNFEAGSPEAQRNGHGFGRR